MKKIIALSIFFVPFISSAQQGVVGQGGATQLGAGFQNLTTGVFFLSSFLRTAVVLIISLAVVYFLWNVFKFVASGGGEEEKRAEAQKGIIYGIIGIAVMVSVWGLVNFFTQSALLSPRVIPAPLLPNI